MIYLSICIPTFNHCQLLGNTLDSIVCQSPFSETDEIEIAISDNCSDDATKEIVSEYIAAFPGKITYSKNETNIGDRNFETALTKGHGEFLKLHNDSLLVRNGALTEMLKIIKATVEEKPILFFTNGSNPNHPPIIPCHNLSGLLSTISYSITWIGGFGSWREDMAAAGEFSRRSDLMLIQVDVLLRMASQARRSIVITPQYFLPQPVGPKGGYSIAKVFGANYLSLLKDYVDRGMLDQATYDNEKRLVYIEHILPYAFNKYHNFDTSGFFQDLREYWTEEYFFTELEKYIFPESSEPVSKPSLPPVATLPLHPPPHNTWRYTPFPELCTKWREMNAHNETTLIRPCNLDRITVGRRTYGSLHVQTWDHPDEQLTIGSFVSIADGVKFLLGGNHFYQGISTFPFKVKYFGDQEEALTKGPVIVQDDVWIGVDSLILSGVTIGQGAIVAAGSVVINDVPAYSIVGGNPAKVIKMRFEQDVINELMRIDFGKLDDDTIHRNSEILYQPMTKENARLLVDSLLSP